MVFLFMYLDVEYDTLKKLLTNLKGVFEIFFSVPFARLYNTTEYYIE